VNNQQHGVELIPADPGEAKWSLPFPIDSYEWRHRSIPPNSRGHVAFAIHSDTIGIKPVTR
jgi:hypothetical protein